MRECSCGTREPRCLPDSAPTDGPIGSVPAMPTATPYALNYDWARLGPHRWTVDSIVTLQVDLESVDQPTSLRSALRAWWQGLDHEHADGEHFASQGGALLVEPVVTEGRHTLWIVSAGEDAFDSIAASAHDVYAAAVPRTRRSASSGPSCRTTGPTSPGGTRARCTSRPDDGSGPIPCGFRHDGWRRMVRSRSGALRRGSLR